MIDLFFREAGGGQLYTQGFLVVGVGELAVVVVLEEVHQYIEKGLFHLTRTGWAGALSGSAIIKANQAR
jgi:hypothetical protein